MTASLDDLVSQVAALSDSVNQTLGAINVQKGFLDRAVTGAQASSGAADGSAQDAAASATAAAGSATAAANSATAASGSAQAAAQSVTDAGAKATAAAGSASAAATSATAASGAATAAGSSAGAAATSAAQAAGSATAATNQATSAAGSASTASQQASNSLANANNASTANTAAQGYAGQAASSASTAQTARDAAIAASQVAANPTEALAALAQIIHSGNLVASFLYDVSKDSDGGAWIKRCQHTSWYNETICTGTWRGQQTNLTAAWNVTGAAVGDFYQNTTDGKFYTIGGTKASPTQTEVFRGNTREFPALSAVLAEAGRAIIYDLTKPGCPMWMVFTQAARNFLSNYVATGGVTSVTTANSNLIIGVANNGTCEISFVADSALFRSQLSIYCRNWSRGIGLRNSNTTTDTQSGAGFLANANVNAVAATVLPDAPTDPVTNLPTPTIAVATAGGVSVIKQDGTVVNSSSASAATSVSINPRNILYWATSAGSNLFYTPLAGIGASFSASSYTHLAVPAFVFATSHRLAPSLSTTSFGNSNGVVLLKENPGTPVKGMVAFIANAYNTGWQVGDSRGCWLADTVAETLAASNVAVNGTFNSDLSGWTAGTGWTWNSGAATKAAGTQSDLTENMACVVGRTYRLSFDVTRTAGNLNLVVFGITQFAVAATSSREFTFVANNASQTITFTGDANFAGTLKNVRCDLVVPDRSVIGKGLIINGSITKSAVATGAQLVAFGGFSASSYLEQPYSSALDPGTGDLCYRVWASPSGVGGEYILARESVASSTAIQMYFNAGVPSVYLKGATGALTLTAPSAVTGIHQIMARVTSGMAYLHVDGAVVASASAASLGSLTDTAAILRVGRGVNATSPLGGVAALLRIEMTAPSLDQIAQIYRDELPMFQPGAQVTLDGTSTAVTALAYDDSTELLQVGTSWGRTAMHGLVRVESSATQVGAVQAISAGAGSHITAGATAGRYVQPTLSLRDELRRKFEAKVALGKEIITADLDFTPGQTSYLLPYGFTTKNVWAAGTPKRMGTTKDYTVGFDGYRETVTFAVAPLASGQSGTVWVRIDMNRR